MGNPSASTLGGPIQTREFYLAAEFPGHRGLVRDVAWADGNIRGYDIIATACSDGFVRVWRLDAVFSLDDGRTWSESDINRHRSHAGHGSGVRNGTGRVDSQHQNTGGGQYQHNSSGIGVNLARSAGFDRSGSSATGGGTGAGVQVGVIPHKIQQVGLHDKDRTPVWRVSFTADGQILGSSGDDGKLILYRKKPDGLWAKYSELGVDRARMVAP